MSFAVDADAYGRFMGRWSEPLAAVFADFAGVRAGQRALDVGCGPGALTAELVRRLGTSEVLAVEPSPSFVAAARSRLPGVDIRAGAAEALPFADDDVDITLAQLVVHFMTDPVAGLAEMGRVTKRGGVVAACVWDHAGDGGPLSTFWRAVRDVDPDAADEGELAGARAGHLAELSAAAGLQVEADDRLTVAVPRVSFEQWWEPFTLGVGPAGAYLAGVAPERRSAIRRRATELMPEVQTHAAAWAVRARVPR